MPFHNILVIPNEEGSLSTTVYRKPTHTDLYLHWDSHHTLPSKYSVIGTLLHRAKTICSNPLLLKQEEDHLHRALTKCKHPAWALNRIKIKSRCQTQKKSSNNKKNAGTDNIQKPHIVVPYRRGVSESFKKMCSNNGVQVYFKGGTTIKNLLMAPKDQDLIHKRSGAIYRYKCDRVECDEEYIGGPQELLERGSRNILRPPPQYLTITTSLVTMSLLRILVLWGERTRTS